MVYKEHFIELWINGSKVELEDQKSLNMRFNNVITDPTKISSNQAEYSFEFEIPATPKNNVILDYANNLGKLNKFHQRYNAEVYADGTVIFSGTITINGFKENKYQLNLVSVKVYSLDDIFGEDTMDKIKLPNGDKWSITFDGVPTINERNAMDSTEVIFPFISYGAFQKRAKYKDNVASDFTSKFDLDEYNDWYMESFPPSHHMLSTLRRAFEWKGKKVGGDVFADERLNKIYMSTNYGDDQDPLYNYANPKLGKVQVDVQWSNYTNVPTATSGNTQSLKFPYWRIGGKWSTETKQVENSEWNFSTIQTYDVLKEGDVTLSDTTYMYQPNEHIIVIPANGFYKIELVAAGTLDEDINSSFQATQWCRNSILNYDLEQSTVTIPYHFRTTTPMEIQLVRNYDENIELIRGKNIFNCYCGDPSVQTYEGHANRYNMTCPFPHEKLGNAWDRMFLLDGYDYAPPTKINDLGHDDTLYNREYNVGYINKDNSLMMYDPAVSKAFICGITSLGNDQGGGCGAVMRDGYSWSRTVSEKNDAFYYQDGYDGASCPVGFYPTNVIYTTATTYNENSYIGAPTQYFSETTTSIAGRVSCLVYLNKNDVLQLFTIIRDYTDEGGNTLPYKVSAHINLSVEAASPNSYAQLIRGSFGYNSPSEFDKDLNLANFLNSEKKVSDWVQNIADAFNLEIIQNGDNVDINIKKKPNLMTAVDIDDKCNHSESEAKAIDYPKSMAVKYKIDEDEWGYERSAVKAAGGDEAILNNEDEWKKLAEKGYSVIQLNDDSYVTSTSEKSLQFSYTWYDTFHWYSVNNKFERTNNTPVDIRIPVISKYEYMIDSWHNYEDDMAHDGYGLPQRFWFKPTSAPYFYVWTRTYPAERVNLYLVNNNTYHLNLSYKDTERSILSEYFNINAYLASNYVLIDVYLSADEYNRIKNGALVHFDSDLYIPVEVSGYDPSGNNATTLKLMKKVA